MHIEPSKDYNNVIHIKTLEESTTTLLQIEKFLKSINAKVKNRTSNMIHARKNYGLNYNGLAIDITLDIDNGANIYNIFTITIDCYFPNEFDIKKIGNKKAEEITTQLQHYLQLQDKIEQEPIQTFSQKSSKENWFTKIFKK